MAIYIEPPEPKVYELPTETIHDLSVKSLKYLGLVSSKNFEPKEKSLITFSCDDQRDSKGEPILVFARFTHSLYKDSNLSKLLAAVGVEKPVPPAKLDLETLVGKKLRGLIVHNVADNGNTYANLERVMPAKPADPTATPTVHHPQPAATKGIVISDDDLPEWARE